MKSFVTGHTQTVIVSKLILSMVKLSRGVPQVSVLVPLLFVLYTKDISASYDVMVCEITATPMIRRLIYEYLYSHNAEIQER